jgi:short-subunit dehydrogenase
MDSLRLELRNVSVVNVCPGSVQTDVAKNSLAKDGSRFGVTDHNIANGQTVQRCVQLMLHAAAFGLHEVWMFGNPTERFGAYAAQYMPATLKLAMGLVKERLLHEAEKVLALRKE